MHHFMIDLKAFTVNIFTGGYVIVGIDRYVVLLVLRFRYVIVRPMITDGLLCKLHFFQEN